MAHSDIVKLDPLMTCARTLLLLLTAALLAAGCSSGPQPAPYSGQPQPPGAASDPVPTPIQPPQETISAASPPTWPERSASEEYRIGRDDELSISVFGNDDLTKTQTVRPDGKIAYPLLGDVQASGNTPNELRAQLTQQLSRYLKSPHVTVVVSKYNSRQVYVLGQVKTPGVLLLSSDINVLQGVARAGGVTEEADLSGALLIRDSKVVPVNFDRLFRMGDFSQNLPLRTNDTILIPNIAAKRIFVLGEVKQSLSIPLRNPVTLIEAISMAGGFTIDAQTKDVVVIRGGLGVGNMLKVNVDDVTALGLTSKNLLLQPNDIVYVPKSLIAEAGTFAERISKIITPFILTEFGVSLINP